MVYKSLTAHMLLYSQAGVWTVLALILDEMMKEYQETLMMTAILLGFTELLSAILF